IYVVDFAGVSAISQNLKMLPLAYDRSTWKDIYTQNVAAQCNVSGSSGERLMHIYPLPGNNSNSGAFGYLSLNDSSVNANDITSWINNGLAPTDLTAVKSSGLFPLPAENLSSSNWQAA